MNGLRLYMRFLPIWMTVLFLNTPMVNATEETPDPPRVARISAIEGSASIWTDEENEWQAVDVNAPILAGDRLYAGVGSRVEVQLGDDVFVRLNEQSYISLPFLEENFVRLEVQQGSVNVNARETEYDRPPVEVLSSTFLATIEEPVNARFDVQTTGAEISVQRGKLNINLDKERFMRIERGEKLIAPTADPDTYTKMPIGPADAFDQWTDIRDAVTVTLPGEPKVSNRISGYRDLDRYGEWIDVPSYGTVWRPTTATTDWAPYREGYWAWRYRYGWVWVSNEPWGWAPYHYGRWVYVNRYNWVWTPHYAAYVGPSYRYRRPYWYPALVSFTYADRGDYFHFSIGGGYHSYNDYVGWFPLGYNDPYYWNWGYYHTYYPNHYYFDDYHRGFHRRGGNTFINNGTIVINDYDYDNEHVRNAVTVMPRQDFTASVYDRKAAATVQTSARRAIAMGENAMRSLPDVSAVRVESQKTKLALRNGNQPMTSPSRTSTDDRSFMTSSKPRGITMADEKPVAITTTKPARLRDAETPRMTMSNPVTEERRLKVAQRSTVDTQSVRQPQAASPARGGQSAERVTTSPARTTSPGRKPAIGDAPTRSRTTPPSVSMPSERSTRNLSQPNSSRSRVRGPQERTSTTLPSSPSRVSQPQERSVQQAPSTVRERSSQAQELRSRRTATQPNSQAASNRQQVTEPSMSMNGSEAARNRSYQINTRSRYLSEEGSRATAPPVRAQSTQDSGSMTTTPRTYNLQGRGAYSITPPRSEPEPNIRVYDRSGNSFQPDVSVPQRYTSTRRSNVQTYTPDVSPQRSYSSNRFPSASPSGSVERNYEVSPSRSSSNRTTTISPSRSESSPSVSPSRTYSSPSRSSSPSVSPSRSYSTPSRSSSPSVSRSQSSRMTSPSRSSSSPSRMSSPSVSSSRSNIGVSRASQLRTSSPARVSSPGSSAAASRARRP